MCDVCMRDVCVVEGGGYTNYKHVCIPVSGRGWLHSMHSWNVT